MQAGQRAELCNHDLQLGLTLSLDFVMVAALFHVLEGPKKLVYQKGRVQGGVLAFGVFVFRPQEFKGLRI